MFYFSDDILEGGNVELKHTAESLGGFAREERGEVVDRDDREGRAHLQAVDGDGRVVKGSGDGVDGHGGEGGGCVLWGVLVQLRSGIGQRGWKRTAETSHTTRRLRSGTCRDSMFTAACKYTPTSI